MSIEQIIKDALRAQGINADFIGTSARPDKQSGCEEAEPHVEVTQETSVNFTCNGVDVVILCDEHKEVTQISVESDIGHSVTFYGDGTTAFLCVMQRAFDRLKSHP